MSSSIDFATCLPAMIAITQAVLSSRVHQGTNWLKLGIDSAAPIDLQIVYQQAPLPILSSVSSKWLSRAWTAALIGKPSVFDTSTSSNNNHNSSKPISIPFDSIVSQISTIINLSPSILITSIILLDRLTTAVPEVLLNIANVHKLFTVAYMIAAKSLEDDYIPATWFASFLGCSDTHIRSMEKLFLKGLDYRVYVTPKQFSVALYTFTAEAIDTSCGLAVMATLPFPLATSTIEKVNTSWQCYSQSKSNSSSPTTITNHTDCIPNQSYRAKSPSYDSSICALAESQLSHDCPGFGSNKSWSDFASRIYSPIGLIRLMALTRLAEGLPAATVLPALELNSSPKSGSLAWEVSSNSSCSSTNLIDYDDPNEKSRRILEGLGWGNLYKSNWQDEIDQMIATDFNVAPVYTAGSIWSSQ